MRTSLRLFVPVSILAVVAAAACDSVHYGNGAGTDPDGSPTATSSDTPTSTTPTPIPSPTSIPDHLGGWFALSNLHSAGNNPPAGIGGSGFFSAQPIPLMMTQPWIDMISEYPDHAVDTCDWGWGASIAIGGSDQVSLNAGDLTLASTSGSGKFLFLPLGGLQLYLTNAMPDVFLPDGGAYTLSATGGQIGAFSHEIAGPADVVVTSPANLASANTITIDRTQDFHIEWQSAHDGLPVFVYLLHFQDADHATAPQNVVCKFADDGEATIPASAFQMFDPTLYGTTDSFQIAKYRASLFDAPNAQGPVLLDFVAGYSLDATYQ